LFNFIARSKDVDIAAPETLANILDMLTTFADAHKKGRKTFTLKNTNPHMLTKLNHANTEMTFAVNLICDAVKNKV